MAAQIVFSILLLAGGFIPAGKVAVRAAAVPAAGMYSTGVPEISRGKDTVRNYEIFGPSYSRVRLNDRRNLEGVVYYLVAGHGGPDSGARGRRSGRVLCEDEYAYDVTLRLARQLIIKGATVYIIIRDRNDGIRDASFLSCDTDETVRGSIPLPVDHLDRLKQRADIVNKLHRRNRRVAFQRLVVLHVDSRQEGDRVDIFFYHHSSSSAGRRTAERLMSTIDKKYDLHQPSRGYHGTVEERDGLYMLRKTRVPAVYIELGNIRNVTDQKRFIYADNRQAMANWLCEGLEEDYVNHLK